MGLTLTAEHPSIRVVRIFGRSVHWRAVHLDLLGAPIGLAEELEGIRREAIRRQITPGFSPTPSHPGLKTPD
jgi:hypothetical protein